MLNEIMTVALAIAITGIAEADYPDFPKTAEKQMIAIEKSWQGKIPVSKRCAKCVADKKTFAAMWKDFRGQEALPTIDGQDIDFTKYLIVIVCAPTPNDLSLELSNDRGTIRAITETSAVFYFEPASCSYVIALIRRGDDLRAFEDTPIEPANPQTGKKTPPKDESPLLGLPTRGRLF